MLPLNIQNENNENLFNFMSVCILPITLTFLTILLSTFLCNKFIKNDDISNDNFEEDDDDDNDNDNDNESLSDTNKLDSDTSEDEDYNNDIQQYSSVMYKAFALLNKKQLIKMTGNKYKYKNKDELIVIAMYKFMIKSIEKSDSLPKGIKIFAIANKKIMKEELLELYKIPSDETSNDEKEIIQ
jgi:hypothetical protein